MKPLKEQIRNQFFILVQSYDKIDRSIIDIMLFVVRSMVLKFD